MLGRMRLMFAVVPAPDKLPSVITCTAVRHSSMCNARMAVVLRCIEQSITLQRRGVTREAADMLDISSNVTQHFIEGDVFAHEHNQGACIC